MALTDKLTAIANAVREKAGTTDAMTLTQIAEAIAAIQTGGGGKELKVAYETFTPAEDIMTYQVTIPADMKTPVVQLLMPNKDDDGFSGGMQFKRYDCGVYFAYNIEGYHGRQFRVDPMKSTTIFYRPSYYNIVSTPFTSSGNLGSGMGSGNFYFRAGQEYLWAIYGY